MGCVRKVLFTFFFFFVFVVNGVLLSEGEEAVIVLVGVVDKYDGLGEELEGLPKRVSM